MDLLGGSGCAGASVSRLVDALRSVRPSGVGIREWSLYSTESRQLALGVKDREAGNVHAPMTLSESYGVRYLIVWEDDRVSRGFLERRQVQGDLAECLASARSASYDDPDAAWVLGPSEFPDVELHSAATAAMAGGDTELLGRRLVDVRRTVDQHGFRTWSASFSFGEAAATVLSSRGLEAGSRGTSAGWFVSLNGEIGGGFSGREADDETAFAERMTRLAETANALDHDGTPMAAGVSPILLHPRVVESYVLGTLLHHLDGPAVAHGESRFERDAFGSGRPVVRPDLSLRLDPLTPMKKGSYRFTIEGLPAQRCAFLEAGCLVQPVLDLKYARRLGLPPTPLPHAMDALHLEGPETLDLDGAYDAADGGALVLSVLGVHTQDSASGDFSLSAPQVLRLTDGRADGRLRGTISGNLFEVLNDEAMRLVRFPGEHTPGMLFGCRFDPK